jgi:hypothetical protein
MLDHTLDVVAYALKLRQSHLLPIAAPPETQSFQAEAWTASVAYGALLHDLGKIAVDLHVEYEDGEQWRPWHGPPCKPFRFRYRRDRQYRLHGAAAGLLYASVLHVSILDWLSDFADPWNLLLYALAGQNERAGILGEIIAQADQASVAAELGGDPSKVRTAPKQALQRKLLDGLRHLVRSELKLNQPRWSDGWLTDDGLWLVSKTVCDKLRAYLLKQGVEGIPSDNIRLFSELQDHGIAQANADGKAIWKGTVTTSDGSGSHTLTLLKVSPALIWDNIERPTRFAGRVQSEECSGDDKKTASVPVPSGRAQADSAKTGGDIETATESAVSLVSTHSASEASAQNETRLASANESHSVHSRQREIESNAGPPMLPIDKASDLPGVRFCTWLRVAIVQRRLVINDAKALVHTVAGTAFLVTPGIFQRYAQEHPEIDRVAAEHKMAGWQWIQKQFERLRIHRKQVSGLNVWPCKVEGPRKTKRVHGYVLNDPQTLFADVPPDNPYLTLLADTATSKPHSRETKRSAAAP